MIRNIRNIISAILCALMTITVHPLEAEESIQRVIVSGTNLKEGDEQFVSSSYADSESSYYVLAFETEQQKRDAVLYYVNTGAYVQEDISLDSEGRITGETCACSDPFAKLSLLNGWIFDSAVIDISSADPSSPGICFADTEYDQASLNSSTDSSTLSLHISDSRGNTCISALLSALKAAELANVQEVVLPFDEAVLQSYPVLLSRVETMKGRGIRFVSPQKSRNISEGKVTEIRSFEIGLISGAVYDNEKNCYVYEAETAAAGHRFTYRISFSTAGIQDIPDNTWVIHLPLHILRKRDGTWGDDFEIALTHESELDETDEMGWRINGDCIEVFNAQTISAAKDGYFEISYYTNEDTYAYEDEVSSDPLSASMTAVNPDGSRVSAEAGSQQVIIDTSAFIVSTQKRTPDVFLSLSQIPTLNIQGNPNEEYLVWEIRTVLADNITQPYTFRLDDVVTSDDTDVRVLGYRFASQETFQPDNAVCSQTTDQMRVDYVLTAHTVSDSTCTINNHITATVIPEDGRDETTSAEAENSYVREPVYFTEPEGNLGSEKYGGYTYYGLEMLQEETSQNMEAIRYNLFFEGYPYPWTLEENADPSEPQNYGQRTVLYSLTDDSLYINSEDGLLEEGDYTFDSIVYNADIHDAAYDETTCTFIETEAEIKPDDILTFYGRFEGEWQRIGIYNLYTSSASFNNALAEITDNEVIFHDECTGFRIETENAHWHTFVSAGVSISLLPSAHVRMLTAGQDRITLTNKEQFSVIQDDQVILQQEKTAQDFIRRSYRDSLLRKRAVMSSNDISSQLYTISWQIFMQETITTYNAHNEPYRQDSGVFYDLLPAGCQTDPETIQVENENGILKKDEYTCQLISDFRHSGRTMMIIRISQPGDSYTVYYDTFHSWESIRDYGQSVLNPVAYQTGNDDIAQGLCDTGETLSDINRSLFADLDPDSDEPQFIYTEQPHNMSVITAAISGLRKKVKAETDRTYSYETVTSQEETYSYQLRFENTQNTSSDHLVFFDSLENYVTDQNGQSGWHGILQSVDVSQLLSKGIQPVIYISTAENLDIEQHHDLNDRTIWTDHYESLEQAKAIAIDMTYADDGSLFTLEPSESVTAVLFMKAPASIADEANNKAFNNVWMHNRITDQNEQAQEYLIHQDYTQISFHTTGEVKVHKVNAQDTEEPIEGITFRLSGTSAYGDVIDSEGSTDRNGNLVFHCIPRGTYTLMETGEYEDWKTDSNEYTVTITDDGNAVYNSNASGDTIIISNQPRIHTDLEFDKRDLTDLSKPVLGAQFRLSGTAADGSEIIRYGQSDVSGKTVIRNIEPGTYILKEISTPDGYIPADISYTVIVDNTGNAVIEGCINNQNNQIIVNEPFHEFTFIKKSSYDSSPLAGAYFSLRGISDYGHEYTGLGISSNRGEVIYSGLEPGTYILQEIIAPEGFLINSKLYAVHIDAYGNAEISGLEKDENNQYIILNEPLRTGTIQIIKRWMGNEEDKPVPVIHLSSQRPSVQPTDVTIDKDKWIDPDTDLPWIAEAVTFEENTSLTLDEVLQIDNVIRIDDEETDHAVYIWTENDENWEWWSDADIIYLPEDSSYLFASCEYLESLDLSRFNTENVTDMCAMFAECHALTEINLSGLNTHNVEDMSYMFQFCRSLEYLSLTPLSTSSVVYMQFMFSNCPQLVTVDLSSFDTSSVLYMDSMFSSDTRLQNIYVSDLWNTANVTNGSYMFRSCKNLPNYNKSNVDVSMAHYGNGGYLTYKAYASAIHNPLFSFFTEVHAEESPETYVSDSQSWLLPEMSEQEKQAVMHSEDGYWQELDGSTWIYTFPVVNPSSSFWFYEDVPAGWTGNCTIWQPGETENGTGTIINFKGTAQEYGQMSITKNVISENTGQNEFTFRITLKDADNQPLQGTDVFGDTAFNDGVAFVNLAHGETVYIADIPVGYRYLVEETASKGYIAASENASGIIGSGISEVHFTNTEETEENVNIRIEKIISGRFEIMEEDFIFHIFLSGLKPDCEYELSDGRIYFSDEYGSADLTCTLHQDEAIVLLDLPAGSTYQVSEEAGDYYSEYEIVDRNDAAVIRYPRKRNEKKQQFLNTAVETAAVGSDIVITFTNRLEYAQEITVTKECSYDADESFEFIAEFEGLQSTDVIETPSGKLRPDENGNIRKVFYLSDGEVMRFTNVPVTVRYTFTEASSMYISSYTIEDRYGRGNVIRQFASSPEPFMSLSTNKETVNQYEDVLITFENILPPQQLTVKKLVRGNMASSSKEYTFTLTLQDNVPEESRYEKTENGTLVSAGVLTFDENNTTRFRLSANQVIKVGNLEAGTDYTLREAEDSSGDCIVNVINEDTTMSTREFTSVITADEDRNTVTYVNERNAVIPTGIHFSDHAVVLFLMGIGLIFMHKFML